MPGASPPSGRPESRKLSTGILLSKIPSGEQRYIARELHESLLDLPWVWAPSEVSEHESIAYRLRGRAFLHMAPPLETDHVELHILEGMYALPTLREMASDLPRSAQVSAHETAPHRHTKGGEIVIRVDRQNLHEVFQFVLRLYRRERGY